MSENEQQKEKKSLQELRIEALRNPNIDSYISLKNINKVYPNGFQAVYDFNLEIKKNEFIVFVGPSGCGKSTTLRMIAGLEDITAGDLYIDQIYSNNLTPKDRDIAMVFQNYALYPHMTVYENMAFGLKMRHVPNEEIDQRVKEAAEMLDLTTLLDRKPRQLSGGQMQRVALGRTIVRKAKAFLMDEPLSNLDAKLRVTMRSEIIKIHQRLNTTSIYVTHDQTEAMTMATRIVVMNKGHIQQIGTPEEIYNSPTNKFVATFIGTPAMNMLKGHYEKGVLSFKDGFSVPFDAARQERIENFFKDEIKTLKDRLENIDYTPFKDLKSYKDLFLNSTAHNDITSPFYKNEIKICLKAVKSLSQINRSKKIDCNKDLSIKQSDGNGNEYTVRLRLREPLRLLEHNGVKRISFFSKCEILKIISSNGEEQINEGVESLYTAYRIFCERYKLTINNDLLTILQDRNGFLKDKI